MKRTKHNLSHSVLASLDMAELAPIGVFDVLPGDSVKQSTSMLLRVSPLVAPVMHSIDVRIHHWFVPYRLVWDNFEKFITGGPDGNDASVPPYITAGGGGFTAGQLMDYMGVKPGMANLQVSALPIRAYNKIWNEYYRDQDLQTELTVPTTDGADATSPLTLAKVNWQKDYFTLARPWTQKGSAVTLPLGTEAIVKTRTTDGFTGTGNQPMRMRVVSTGNVPGAANLVGASNSAGELQRSTTAYTASGDNLYPANLYADLTGATAASVNTIRRAFALQRFEEARAAWGSRFSEYLRAAFGVRSSDARLQRPEYLGGGKQTIAFSEVLQTAPTTSGSAAGVGELKGHGISAVRTNSYRRYFEEHGIVMTLLSVRPRAVYGDSLERFWNKTTKFDFFQKELEAIGQQEIYRREVYAQSDAAGGNTVFGYGDRYSEYRGIRSRVAGEYRTSTLNFWHLARMLGAAPALNSSFIECDPSKRIHTTTANDVLWAQIHHRIGARRIVSKTVVGRIV